MNTSDPMKSLQTPDLLQEQLARLKAEFPDLFTNEGRLNPAELLRLTGEMQRDHFDFSWSGKAAAKRHGLTPMARVLGGATAGVAPRIMGIGPAPATLKVLAQTGLIAMIGKAERGPVAIEAIKKHKSAYLMAVGGAAYLVSKAIKHAKVVGFADLGMEAIYEFDVVDMPVTVAVDSGGTSAHITGPAEWQKRIATGEFKGIGVSAG